VRGIVFALVVALAFWVTLTVVIMTNWWRLA
jgi:hypothetical protein